MKRITLLFIGAIILIIIMIFYSLSTFSVMNIIPRASLPKQYLGYVEIKEGDLSDKHRSVLLFNSTSKMEYYAPLFNKNDNTVIVKKQKGDVIIYIKLNVAGEQIDSLTFSEEWPNEFSGYLLNANAYCSWMIDGDIATHKFKVENAALTEDSVSLKKHYDKLHDSAQLVYYFSYNDLNDDFMSNHLADKVIFLHNGAWVSLLGKNLTNYKIIDSKTKELPNVSRMANLTNVEHMEKRNAFIYMDYFQKEHYSKGKGSSLGSVTGNTTTDQWEGVGYINLMLKKDTIYVKQDMNEYEGEGLLYFRSSPTFYFTNDKIKFGLFSNDGYKMYLLMGKN